MTGTTNDFDRLISGAAPAVPDCAADRRVTRALLHQLMRPVRRRQQRLHTQGLAWAASLTFLLVFWGQVGQLGSDGFEFKLVPLELGNGETIDLVKNPLRGTVMGSPAGMSHDGVRELQELTYLREGHIQSIEATSFGGRIPTWFINFENVVDGRNIVMQTEPQNLSVPSSAPVRKELPFFMTEYNDFLALVESGQLKAEPYGQVSSDGLTFEVQRWTKFYPKWGQFTHYLGLPTIESGSPGK